ncbi:MAG: FAD-binding oxidoreductase [Desmonostoc geniculatum HA4340-LM1]|nr:FAD-binding oxidoreductase [Desmonostoc geniculatum HA4340-LM1]
MESLLNAISAWEQLLGSENVRVDEETRVAAQTATFATKQTVSALIQPSDRTQVQKCLEIANQYKTPIYPISTGKNWGYGSRVPSQDGCVIMDLSRLNRIVDYNETLAYVTVEPGVTQRQLFEYLQEKNSNLLMSMTGSTPDSSLIGNILERGEAKGLLGDRFSHVCSLEVILPTGECIHTGLDRFSDAKAASVNRWGVGPSFDGIFTQSNLGIVTQMTIWLLPYPKYFQAFFYSINDDSRLEELIDTLRLLKLEGLIKTTFHINNDYRMLSLQQQYPWQTLDGKTPFPPTLLPNFNHNWGGGVWIGEGALYSASPEQGKVERKLIQKALGKLTNKLVFFDKNKFKFATALSPIFKRFTGIDIKDKVDLIYNKNPQRGIPTERVLRMAYWRKETPIPHKMDLDQDGCGMIWCVPAVPFQGIHVRNALNIIEETAHSYEYEPNIGLNCITDRNININAAIFYDRDRQGEDEKALACHDEMLQKLIEKGYLPYRLSTHSMSALPPVKDEYGQLIRKIKETLDPNNILAPGRYDFRQDW